jgi:hypothetical protein
MANLYEALQRGRQEAGAIAPALPCVAKPSPAVFGLEMWTLSSRLQPLFDDRKPVTASSSGEGASMVARELVYHIAAEGRSMLHCGDPADLDTMRMVFGRPYQLTQSLIDPALATAPLSIMDAE